MQTEYLSGRRLMPLSKTEHVSCAPAFVAQAFRCAYFLEGFCLETFFFFGLHFAQPRLHVLSINAHGGVIFKKHHDRKGQQHNDECCNHEF